MAQLHFGFKSRLRDIEAQSVRYQRRWYVILHNTELGVAWTSEPLGSGKRGAAEAAYQCLSYCMGSMKLPQSMMTEIPESKEEYTGAIEQNHRTCTLCTRRYRTSELLGQHLQVCPSKHFAGFFIPHTPEAK